MRNAHHGVPDMPQSRRRFVGLSRTDIWRLAGVVLGGLFAGWLVGEVAQLIPGLRPPSVMGGTPAQSPFRQAQLPSPTPAVPHSDGAPAVTVSEGSSEVARRHVRPLRRVATPRLTTTESSIEPNDAARTTETSETDAAEVSSEAAAPLAVIDWLLDRSSRGH